MNFLNPKKIISSVAVGKGSTVADFGFGSGAFLQLLSREVGLSGRIYAFDIQEEILKTVKKAFEEQKINNVDFLNVDLQEENSTKLKDNSVDFVLISSLFFQLEKKEEVAKEAYRILRPNGRILFIEWRDSFSGLGPDKNLIFPEIDAINLFKQINLDLERRIESGDYHYSLIFRKK